MHKWRAQNILQFWAPSTSHEHEWSHNLSDDNASTDHCHLLETHTHRILRSRIHARSWQYGARRDLPVLQRLSTIVLMFKTVTVTANTRSSWRIYQTAGGFIIRRIFPCKNSVPGILARPPTSTGHTLAITVVIQARIHHTVCACTRIYRSETWLQFCKKDNHSVS